jgi:hypothetical protein
MSCKICWECREMLDRLGLPSGSRIYGGPYLGYRLPDGSTEVLEKKDGQR